MNFINTLKPLLESLCLQADTDNFENVTVYRLSRGSVVADSQAVYHYPNNELDIQFINTGLEKVLNRILHNTTNLDMITQAFNASNATTIETITLEPPSIHNITDMRPFLNCSDYANYTAELVNGTQWHCSGPCKMNPDYCHWHGDCLNHIYDGAICRCYKSHLGEYHGPRCQLYRRLPGFYGAVFGSIAAAVLILILVVAAVFSTKKYGGIWARTDSLNKNLDALEEDFFDFSYTGLDDAEAAETLAPPAAGVDVTSGGGGKS